jgi:hypothetical protein
MFGRRYVPNWMGGWCLKKEWHQGKKRKNKVDAEEIDRVLCAFAVAPWWWFGHTRDLRVVVVVSCYHGTPLNQPVATTKKHAAATLTMAQKPHHDESVLAAFLANPCQLPRICQ